MDSSFTETQMAARLIADADGLLITAGAGMGVDSGLPDFRGPQGFWRAYPALGRQGLDFEGIASTATFHSDPALAWGFYGHRLALYRKVAGHEGFAILRQIASRLNHGAFIYTSNVDGHFQKAGFRETQVVECHGSIHFLQCLNQCSNQIWLADALQPVIDEFTCRLLSPLPVCPACGALARPNILMFHDGDWNSSRTVRQRQRRDEWLKAAKNLVVIELGAGMAISVVRAFGEQTGHPLIRINPHAALGSGLS